MYARPEINEYPNISESDLPIKKCENCYEEFPWKGKPHNCVQYLSKELENMKQAEQVRKNDEDLKQSQHEEFTASIQQLIRSNQEKFEALENKVDKLTEDSE